MSWLHWFPYYGSTGSIDSAGSTGSTGSTGSRCPPYLEGVGLRHARGRELAAALHAKAGADIRAVLQLRAADRVVGAGVTLGGACGRGAEGALDEDVALE